jgi:hypothetical protein
MSTDEFFGYWLADSAVCVLFTGALVVVPWLWFVRRRAVNIAGPLLLRATISRARFWSVGCLVLFAFAVAAGWVEFFLLAYFRRRDLEIPPILPTMMFLFGLAAYLLRINRGEVEFRENGLIENGTLYWPWSAIQEWSWEDENSVLRLKISKYGIVHYRLDPIHQNRMHEVLCNRVPRKSTVTST